MTAVLAAIHRHPLKSHGREALPRVQLLAGQAMPWDRRWAVAHEAARLRPGEWAACSNFSRGAKAPALMAIEASLDEPGGQLTLTHPERPAITFDPEDERDVARFIDWVLPLCPADRARPVGVHALPGRGVTDTDYPSVSIISLASNRALSDRLGVEISPLRWRANLWLDAPTPWAERDWIGRRLRIGDAVLQVVEPIVRCLATAANPRTGQRDLDTLGGLKALHGEAVFGLYAKVIESGEIRVGDKAEVLA